MPDFFKDVVVPSLKEGANINVIQTGFEDYVAKQGEAVSKGIRENRDTILEEKRTLSEQFKVVQDKYAFLEGKEFDGKEFGAEVFNKMNSDLESYKTSSDKDQEDFRTQLTDQYEKGKSAQSQTLEPTINSLNLKLEEAIASRDNYQDRYKSYIKDSVLRKAVSDIGADMDEWTFEGFKNSAKIEYDEDGGIKGIAVKHDKSDIPIEDWQKIFPTTDRGKRLIKAPINTGLGGKGGSSLPGSATTLDDISNIPDDKARRVALAQFMADKG